MAPKPAPKRTAASTDTTQAYLDSLSSAKEARRGLMAGGGGDILYLLQGDRAAAVKAAAKKKAHEDSVAVAERPWRERARARGAAESDSLNQLLGAAARKMAERDSTIAAQPAKGKKRKK